MRATFKILQEHESILPRVDSVSPHELFSRFRENNIYLDGVISNVRGAIDSMSVGLPHQESSFEIPLVLAQYPFSYQEETEQSQTSAIVNEYSYKSKDELYKINIQNYNVEPCYITNKSLSGILFNLRTLELTNDRKQAEENASKLIAASKVCLDTYNLREEFEVSLYYEEYVGYIGVSHLDIALELIFERQISKKFDDKHKNRR